MDNKNIEQKIEAAEDKLSQLETSANDTMLKMMVEYAEDSRRASRRMLKIIIILIVCLTLSLSFMGVFYAQQIQIVQNKFIDFLKGYDIESSTIDIKSEAGNANYQKAGHDATIVNGTDTR